MWQYDYLSFEIINYGDELAHPCGDGFYIGDFIHFREYLYTCIYNRFDWRQCSGIGGSYDNFSQDYIEDNYCCISDFCHNHDIQINIDRQAELLEDNAIGCQFQ